jgi:hypothetical protein
LFVLYAGATHNTANNDLIAQLQKQLATEKMCKVQVMNNIIYCLIKSLIIILQTVKKLEEVMHEKKQTEGLMKGKNQRMAEMQRRDKEFKKLQQEMYDERKMHENRLMIIEAEKSDLQVSFVCNLVRVFYNFAFLGNVNGRVTSA